MKVSRDTQQSLVFFVGLFGLIAQGFVMPLVDRPVSIPLCLVFLTMAGVVGVPALLGAILPSIDSGEKRRADRDGDPHE